MRELVGVAWCVQVVVIAACILASSLSAEPLFTSLALLFVLLSVPVHMLMCRFEHPSAPTIRDGAAGAGAGAGAVGMPDLDGDEGGAVAEGGGGGYGGGSKGGYARIRGAEDDRAAAEGAAARSRGAAGGATGRARSSYAPLHAHEDEEEDEEWKQQEEEEGENLHSTYNILSPPDRDGS